MFVSFIHLYCLKIRSIPLKKYILLKITLYNFKEVLNTFNRTDKIIVIFFVIVQNKFWCIESKNLQCSPSVVYLKTEQERYQYPWPEFNRIYLWEQELGKKYPYEMVCSSIWLSHKLALCLCDLFVPTFWSLSPGCPACQWVPQPLSRSSTYGEKGRAWQGMPLP